MPHAAVFNLRKKTARKTAENRKKTQKPLQPQKPHLAKKNVTSGLLLGLILFRCVAPRQIWSHSAIPRMLPARPDVTALQEKVHTLCYAAHKPEGLPYLHSAELKDFEITISLSQTRYIVLSCRATYFFLVLLKK